jgi:hypothetical protein
MACFAFLWGIVPSSPFLPGMQQITYQFAMYDELSIEQHLLGALSSLFLRYLDFLGRLGCAFRVCHLAITNFSYS